MRGYLRFVHHDLIASSDIATGVGLEPYECFSISQPQNYMPITRTFYESIQQRPLRIAPEPASASFDVIINRTLTPTELLRAGKIKESHLQDYKVYCLIRNPIERALSLFFWAIERRNVEWHDKKVFESWLEFDNRVHYLWKQQHDWHLLDGELITEPILYESFSDEFNEVIKNDFGKPKNNGTRFVLSEEMSRPDWCIEVLQDYKEILLQRYHEDINLWISIYRDKKGIEPKIFKD